MGSAWGGPAVYRENGKLIVSATDMVGYLACPHYTTLSLRQADAVRAERSATVSAAVSAAVAGPDRDALPVGETDLDVVTRRGLEHEANYLESLKAEGLVVVEIAEDGSLVERERLTAEALAGGADVVFQGTFIDSTSDGAAWRGHADFLVRVDHDDHTFSYEPEDTKLARHVKPSALLQLCLYAEQLERLQGAAPEQIHVVLGGQERVSFATSDLSAYYRRAKHRFLTASDVGPQPEAMAPATYPTPVEHCGICRYAEQCDDQRTADGHLSAVARLTGEQARKLSDSGVSTVAALAATGDDFTARGISANTLIRLRRQARLQVQRCDHPEDPPPVELLAPGGQDQGLEALPLPNPGDLFFDIEGDPYVGDGGLEYLLGVGWIVGGSFEFASFWGHDPAGEKAAFEQFIDFVMERRRQHPDLHIYHYAPYEPAALGKLAGRHGTREVEVDQLLRGRVLVDLYRVVTQSIAVGSPSYSIKKLEPLYMAPRDAAITDAGSSIVEYERWLQTEDQTILDDIEAYNRDDCESTWLLRDWLEARRSDAEAQFGVVLERASAASDTASDGVAAGNVEVEALVARLTAGLDADIDAAPAPDLTQPSARWLLAQLLDWHRREAKPEWWMYFHRIFECTDDDLFADTEAIAGLIYEGEMGQVKQSMVHRYRFDPGQEHKLKVGAPVADPAAERRKLQGGASAGTVGEIVALDLTGGTVDLKRSLRSTADHPLSLIPTGPVSTIALEDSVRRVANDIIDNGLAVSGRERSPGQAIRDVLLRRPPHVTGIAAGDPLVDRSSEIDTVATATDLSLRLDHSYLPIQGPPGCGKTYTAARVILQLIDAGKRVGITANSHSVITNLVDAVLKASDEGVGRRPPRIVQKGDTGQVSTDDRVVRAKDNKVVEGRLADGDVDIVAGTQWLFAREQLAAAFDHLVIDEAGQLSLANVVAVSPSASNLILVGDPQQLAQPSKGSHPPGAEQSGLEYLLDGHQTVPDERGLFLGRTYRMHPAVCEFVSELAYENRLGSIAGCELQSVAEGPLASGSGVRWRPVEHQGNRTSSTEEAAVVAELYESLLGREWTNFNGETSPLTAADIVVVAPYNAQVHLLAERLGNAARVGTVDKFQGQEGAVVIVSMTASSAEDVPRGMEFLYSRNRLNVAVSRARAMSILVASPALLSARCRTVEQMRLVNGLCRYAELAETQSAGA